MSDQIQFDLPDECWELVFRSLGHPRHYASVSSVCKRFLSISPTPFIPPSPFPSFLRFPAINSIDLSDFHGDINSVLKKCSEIRHLNLAFGFKLSLTSEINFNFLLSNLEVLNLSFTSIDDQSLSLISNTCCGLIHLELHKCSEVTEKGVKQVVQKCTRHREINLWKCYNVMANIVYWMVSERLTLRKIKAPPLYVLSQRHKNLFSRRGCLVFEDEEIDFAESDGESEESDEEIDFPVLEEILFFWGE